MIKKGSFDDDTDNSQKVWGLYTTTALSTLSSSLDLYSLGFENNDSHYTQVSGKERRYSIGSRIFGEANGFDWDNEVVCQFGHIEQHDIRAWSASAHGGIRQVAGCGNRVLAVRLVLPAETKTPHDHQLNTFNAMYPKLPYLTENGLVAPANLIAIHQSITLTPWQTVSLDLSWDAMWRQRQEDGFYLGPMRPVKGSTQGSRFIGNQYQVESTWTPRSWLQFKAAYVYFDVGDSLQRHAGLKNMNFELAQGTISF